MKVKSAEFKTVNTFIIKPLELVSYNGRYVWEGKGGIEFLCMRK